MKLGTVPRDDKHHVYCIACRRETVTSITLDGHPGHHCTSCGHEDLRALDIDPAITWWVAADGEYWHEVAGVFLRRRNTGKFLFFQRTKYPLGLTIPAGHVDRGELPCHTATRELREESGLSLPQHAFRHILTDDVVGDKCRRGCDAHRWHAYAARVPGSVRITVDAKEGYRPIWLTLGEALRRKPTFAIQYMIQRHGAAIMRMTTS